MIERKKRLIPGLTALAVFVLLGVIFYPGSVQHGPAPSTSPSAFRSPPDRAASIAVPKSVMARLNASTGEASSAADASPDTFDCMIQPSEVVRIGSATTGLIDSIRVERGDYVSQHEIVAELESEVAAASGVNGSQDTFLNRMNCAKAVRVSTVKSTSSAFSG